MLEFLAISQKPNLSFSNSIIPACLKRVSVQNLCCPVMDRNGFRQMVANIRHQTLIWHSEEEEYGLDHYFHKYELSFCSTQAFD